MVHFDDAGRERIDERTIVRNEHQRAFEIAERVFENFTGFDIEMVCRFIKHEKARWPK